jgi:hypothetical protein
MEYTVFYEQWQMECCGTPFAVGDTIRWLVYKTIGLNTAIDIGKIDYCYEAHSDKWEKLYVFTGRVQSIKILYERFEREKEDSPMMKRVDGTLMDTEAVDGAEDDVDAMEASGYVVRLSAVKVRPAKKDEVSFQ